MKSVSAVLLLATCVLSGCTKHATRPSPDVTFLGDALLYRGTPFTGILEERFEQVSTTRKSRYVAGIMHGTQEEFNDNGQIVARREYTHGKKTGVHEGWFPDGHRRFHYEYANGTYDGESWEWYDSGALALYARFKNGQAIGKKMWRETGQIYMNYVFTPEGVAGTPGSKLCFQVRKSEDLRIKAN